MVCVFVCASIEYKLLKDRHFTFFLGTFYSGFLKVIYVKYGCKKIHKSKNNN